MSTSTSSEHEFQGMLKHLDSLFTMAQVLTLDAEKASALVEDTYNRALKIRKNNPLTPGDRRHLLQLLIQVHNEQKLTIIPPIEALEKQAEAPAEESFKQRILSQYLSRSIPASFASMDDSDRVVLSLCEIKRLSYADAALILGRDSDAVGVQLNLAKKRLKQNIESNAPPAIRTLLSDDRSEDWLSKALRQSLKEEFTAIPPTLEPKIQSVFTRQDPEAARRALATRSTDHKADKGSRMTRGLVTVFLILTAGFVGYIGSSLMLSSKDANLLTLSASKAPRVETVHATSNLADAETFVQQQMQWRLSLPSISDGALTGVGISEIADEVRVPVFLYRDDVEPNNDYITIYAFTYALLDQYSDRIQLEGDILEAIAGENTFDLHDLNDKQKFVIWRNANDIFMAVTAGDPIELRNRITVK